MSAFTFLDAIAALPPPYDSDAVARGFEDLARALDRLDDEVRDAFQQIACEPAVRGLLSAVFGNSPFLARTLIGRAVDLPRLLTTAPADSAAWIEDEMRAAVLSDGADEKQAMTALRIAKARLALLVALADIASLWELEQVTGALSDFAAAALQASIDWQLGALAGRGDITLADPARPSRDSGLSVIGMGKLGARELNYSSDIDIIVFYEPEAVPYHGRQSLHAAFVRLVQGLVRHLQQPTADGYVFRTDLRLRPDPGVTPVVSSIAAAESYYESMGQNWERAAMIKARPVAGDLAAGEAFLAGLRPFIWRKYLDFAAIEDVHSIKRQIHSHRGHRDLAVNGHDMKLGRGGIRDIEFFVQTQQLIAGGRDESLRDRGTLAAMAALQAAGWIGADVVEDLTAAYRFHRRLEHRLQMIGDQQTHALPKADDGLDQIARFMGFSETPRFRAEVMRHLEAVQRHYAALFERAPTLGEGGNLVFTGTDDDPETLETLAALGYREPANVSKAVRGWHHGRLRATRSARAREILTAMVPDLLRRIAGTADPAATLARFDRFLAGLPAGVQLFSMLRADARLLDLLIEVMGSAPSLADYLSRHTGVLDAVLDTDFFGPPKSADLHQASLAKALRQADDFQDRLDGLRVWTRERKFRIGVQILRGIADATIAGWALSDIADTVLCALADQVEAEFAARHGRIPGGELAIIAMGKLGGREMTATSDLDLIFVYDYPADSNQSDGEKALASSHYYARLCQRLLNALTAQTGAGDLYEVDMRLRPSGNKGPLAVHFDGFAAYQRDSAWTWEHMALSRARVVRGSEAMHPRIEAVIREVLMRRRDRRASAKQVREMRERVWREKGREHPWALKQGRGGQLDIEFISQFLQLTTAHRHPAVLARATVDCLAALRAAGALGEADAAALIAAARLQANLIGLLRVSLSGPFDPATAPEGLKTRLASIAGLETFDDLATELAASQARVRDAFERLIV